jgi:hypothetical protein
MNGRRNRSKKKNASPENWWPNMGLDSLMRRVNDLELKQKHGEPVEYVIRWLEPGEKPKGPDVIRLRWLDDLEK